jgi:2-oxoglutarate dehydrogenase E1 component
LHRDFRKPLILMTPKSLLRHPMCISDASDFTDGSTFHRILWDDAQRGHSAQKLKADDQIKRVVLCTGKVYFDLLAERDARGLDDTYLMRIEQLYPVPTIPLTTEFSRFKDAEFVWCQEEPKNQGAWTFIEPEIETLLLKIGAKNPRPRYAGRVASASPATGLASKHKLEQQTLVNDALA